MTNLMTYSLSTLLALTIGACASGQKQESQSSQNSTATASIEAKQVAAEIQAAFVTEIKFRKNEHKLTAESRTKIKNVVDKAKKTGALDQVQIAVWADQEYPSIHTRNLSTEQVDLAQRRGDEIKEFLKSIDNDLDPKIHNMAKRPGMWSDFVATEGARLKRAFEVAGIPNSDTSVKLPSKVAHSVVLLSIEEKSE